MNELVRLDVSFEYTPRVYVYKREKSWAWKFKLPTGAWFYGTAGKTKAVAERNARKKEQELAKGYFQQAEINKIHDTSGKFHTFETAIEEYIDSLRAEGASPNYYERLEMQLLASARYFVEEKNVSLVHKLTEDHAYAFRKMLLHRVQDEEISRPSAFRALNDTKNH